MDELERLARLEELVARMAAEQVALDGSGGVTGLWAEATGAFLPALVDVCADLRRIVRPSVSRG